MKTTHDKGTPASAGDFTDAELAEFKGLLDAKLAEARADLALLEKDLQNVANDAKGDDFAGEQMTREETQQLKGRQETFIRQLEAALVRIANKSYGRCRVTGQLISKERLRLVPHATLSIQAKSAQG